MELRIRVGAAADASLATVFRPLFAASAAAQKKVEADFAKTARAAGRAGDDAAKAQIGQINRVVAANRSAAKVQADLIRSVQQQRNREHAQFLQELREQEREAKRAAKAIAEEQKKQARAARVADREAGQIGSAAMRTFGGVMRRGVGVAGSILQGAGVDTSIAGLTSKVVSLEDLAVGIVNASNRGQGTAAGRDAMAVDLQAKARDIGNRYAIDPSKVLSGLGQYQALTGDLDTGFAGLERSAALAKAFKVDLDAMIASAGQVGSAIGEIGEGKEFAGAEEKAAAIDDVLRTLTAQGQEGAIEIANMATQMAKLKAAGGRFEGSTAESIKRMGALAQLSLQLGGSASPTQAATSVMGFANTLSTPARRAHFREFGVDIMSKTEAGAFANPFEIIKRSLTATAGDVEKMKKMWANVVGERAVTALATTYRKAGGGEKGLAAVDAQFARFSGTVTDEQINENVARELRTTASQAQLAQNELEQIAATAAKDVIPALREMAPAAKDAAGMLASLVTFSAQHPVAAIGTALAASIAKEHIGKMVADKLGQVLGGAGASAVGLTITAGAVTLMAMKTIFDAGDEAATKQLQGDAKAMELDAILRGAKKTGLISKEDAAKLDPGIAELQGKIQLAESEQRQLLPGKFGATLRAAENYVTGGPGLSTLYQAQDNIEKLPELKQQLAELQEMKRALGTGIKIANVAEIAAAVAGKQGPQGPGVDNGARGDANQ